MFGITSDLSGMSCSIDLRSVFCFMIRSARKKLKVALGITTRNKKLLVAKHLTTSSKKLRVAPGHLS